MNNRLNDLKKALGALGNFDQESRNLVPQASIPELVAVGQRLWWIIKKATKALEPIKERLRAETSGKTQKFESGDGAHCMVLCQAPKVVLRKNFDMHKLENVLGHVKFSELFEETITYKPRKDFQRLMKDCTLEELQAVLEAVDIISETARISFKD